jgi:NAD(P)-dependent dehydrogenase (short-subunit alcohol dehydrogenase family)
MARISEFGSGSGAFHGVRSGAILGTNLERALGLSILFDREGQLKLVGKRAVVTGASQGLGLRIAEDLLLEGASVLICARNSGDLERSARQLQEKAPGRVHSLICDVAVEAEVNALVAEAELRLGGTDILVANAGVYGPKGALEDIDWPSWVEAIAINLTGTVYCCRAFLPLLKRSPRGKVVILSGGGATKPLPFLSAYAASKAGIVRFGETLAEELKQFGIDVNMVAPGALNTRLLDEVLAAGPGKVGEAFFQSACKQKATGGTPLDRGAQLCSFLASPESDGISGRLISAQWDPWPKLGEFKDDLISTDVYTLRRIVPEDRGKDWEKR